MADGAGFRAALTGDAVRHVDRHDRRHFGAAVAFERRDAVLLFVFARQRLTQLFRADDRVFQALELLGRALPQIRAAERRRRDHQRDFVFLDELADRARIHRIRVIDDAEAVEQRQPQRAGEAERMEERKHAEHAVFAGHPVDLADAFDVGQDVAMRQHHALRRAGAAARKDHRGEVVGFRLLPVDRRAAAGARAAARRPRR